MKYWPSLAAFMLVLSIFGCQRQAESPETTGPKARRVVVSDITGASGSKGMPQVQVHLGDRNDEQWGHLAFDIVAVQRERRLLDAPPWHAEGGDWTFLDCRIPADPPVAFLVGLRGKGKSGEVFLGWGEATLLTFDRVAGERFLEVFGEAFHQKPPKARTAQPLRSWKFGTAILGEDLVREPGGGFGAEGGNWSATKWFPEMDGFNAEVFFNYNLVLRKGEFSEKDLGYREGLLGAFASALRDGPRPERTPQTDPNLTDHGPRIEEIDRVCPRAGHFLFSPGSKWIVYTVEEKGQPSRVMKVDPTKPGERIELAQLEKRIDGLTCVDAEAAQLIIREMLPRQPLGYSSEDPVRLWWIDRAKNLRLQLKGPWGDKHISLGEKPVSPDGRFVAIETWRSRADKSGNYRVLHIHDRQRGESQTIEIPNKILQQVGWLNREASVQVAFVEGSPWEKDAKLTYYLADPVTGKYRTVDPPPLTLPDRVKMESPDGSRIAELRDHDKLQITDKQSARQRVFIFHEDDRRYLGEDSFEWVHPRYLKFVAPRLAFLDVQTMKMNYPVANSKEDSGYTFSPDFHWVLWQRAEQGLFLGRVVGVENGR